jgi:hypothetical protein
MGIFTDVDSVRPLSITNSFGFVGDGYGLLSAFDDSIAAVPDSSFRTIHRFNVGIFTRKSSYEINETKYYKTKVTSKSKRARD